MDNNLIIGNVCTLLAMGANAASSTRKSVKGVLRVQNLSQVIYFLSAVVLGGYSAAVQNVVSILRNITAIRNIKSRTLEWILTGAGVVLGIAFNNRGLMGWLPVLANLQYTLVIFCLKDNERALKLSFLLSSISFAVFNIVLRNYVGVVSDFTVAVITAVVLVKGMIRKPEQSPDENDQRDSMRR